MALVTFLIQELDRGGGALLSSLAAKSLTDALLYLLLTGQPHSHSALLRSPVPAGGRHYVKRIEEYLDANADRPAHARGSRGVDRVSSGRSIQAGFRAHRGCTPMEFLRARRLERAHALLLSGPARSVTDVALDCGFGHAGRFSIDYRARFGESPMETRRRALGGLLPENDRRQLKR